MRPLKIIYVILVLASFITFSSNIAQATPSSQALYYEFDLGGGLWRYDYILYNTSDPIADAGYDLYDAIISFDPLATFTGLSVPSGWDSIDGSGFAEAFSINPGPPPDGTDIPPGASLAGFSFEIDYQAGNLPFEATFANPIDPDNPFVYSGTTAPVPEPATLLLLASGLAGLGYLKGRRLFKS